MRIGEASALAWLIPFAIAAVYLVVFVLQFPHNLWVVGWYSDYASDLTMTEELARFGVGANTVLGTAGGWIPLWFGLLTATLPLHRDLWQLAPTAVFLSTALAVGWSVAQVSDRRAGALSALLIFVAAPRALYVFISPIPHSMVAYFGTALLGAYLVWLTKAKGRAPAVRWTAVALAGIALGLFIASDALLIATGFVPFVITAILAGIRRGQRSRLVAASALVSAAIAIPVALLTAALMKSLGFVVLSPSNAIAPLSTLPRHGELMWEGLKALFNGYLSQTPYSALGVACELITVAALGTLLVVGIYTTAKFMFPSLRRGERVMLARSLHIIYWAGSAGATCVSFALSIRTEYIHEAYYATLVLSVAAVVVLLMQSRSPARWLVSAGASIFFAASVVGLTSHYMESYLLPLARTYQLQPYIPAIAHDEPQIVSFAKANHVTVGYAGYEDAPGVTWSSGEQITVRPVQACQTPHGVGMCPFFVELVPAAYKPSRQHTFLLVDSTETFLSTLPPGLGKPIATRVFGPVTMYVYSYDVAAKMGAPSD